MRYVGPRFATPSAHLPRGFPMCTLVCILLLAILTPSAHAQANPSDGVVHHWRSLGEVPGGAQYRIRIVYLEDTAHIERAGPKRLVSWTNGPEEIPAL